MGLAVLILIAILVWYYGHSLKVTSAVDSQLKSTLLTELLGIKDALTQVGKNITDLKGKMTRIDDYAHSANVEWKYFNKQKIDQMLQKLDEIGVLSVAVDNIHDRLGSIESAIDSIAAHPAFTWSKDKD